MGISGGGATDESGLVVRDQKTDKGKGDNVEQSNTPEHLLNGSGEGLSRVRGLSSGQTDQLSAGEGEGGVDEDTAETLETVVEGTRVVPVLSTNVSTLRTTAAVDNDSEDTRKGQLA